MEEQPVCSCEIIHEDVVRDVRAQLLDRSAIFLSPPFSSCSVTARAFRFCTLWSSMSSVSVIWWHCSV